jgi:hypothetical protein
MSLDERPRAARRGHWRPGRSGGRPGIDAYSGLQTQIIDKSADRVRE